jgi:hypothetical protein
MKKEGSIGTAAVLALATVVGFAVYPSGPNPQTGNPNAASAAAKSNGPRTGLNPPTTPPPKIPKPQPWCDDLTERLVSFLKITDTAKIVRAADCYEPAEHPGEPDTPPQSDEVRKATSHLKFVVALLPDPLHTHLPVLFDEFTGAIQEAGQDEKYEFDSSWLPWQDEEPDYALLTDRQSADHVKSMREKQPGVILFRRTPSDPPQLESLLPEYQNGLVVFVVGEDATHGIHREQFRNAFEWISRLDPEARTRQGSVSILGPSFSGSLPSLAQLLLEPGIRKLWKMPQPVNPVTGIPTAPCAQLFIYSGAVGGASSAQWFRRQFPEACSASVLQPEVVFHSFIADDDTLLEQFCNYMSGEQPEFDGKKVAIVSEDETAYGASSGSSGCSSQFLKIFYPRDISALRGAYQTRSIFDSGLPSQPSEAQRKNLPTDLADPAGEVHDSIKSYGGNQTPQVQEAFLLQLVAALHDFHVHYVILRSSNSLDQVFLTNFLRRTYPDGRIVIVGSDLLFSRERGATGLSGIMTVSTYPLSSPARRWTDYARRSSDRVFSSDQSEGTYIALRLLLNSSASDFGRAQFDSCHAFPSEDHVVFLPRVLCSGQHPIPDYSLPYWLRSNDCVGPPDHESCAYSGPPVWLSAVGQNKLWPLAALTRHTDRETSLWEKLRGDLQVASSPNDSAPGRRPEMPLVMKIFWLVLVAFAAFHAWCCRSGSVTARPAFLAQFAPIGSPQQETLLFICSCLVAFIALLTAFGCAAFLPPAYKFIYSWFALGAATIVCSLAAFSTFATNRCGFRLTDDRLEAAYSKPGVRLGFAKLSRVRSYWQRRSAQRFRSLLGALLLFICLSILPILWVTRPANQPLASWRAMNLLSGLSWLVPLLAMLTGLYLAGWFALHGLALLGDDRPLLPPKTHLRLPIDSKEGVLSMFSREGAQVPIEELCQPWNSRFLIISFLSLVAFVLVDAVTVWGFPIRSMGPRNYAAVVIGWGCICGSLLLAESCRLYMIWGNLRMLLVFLDRLPLRRTLGALHGFSWGSVWKMGGNVFELRYKFISRQIECMNHTIQSIAEAPRHGLVDPVAARAAEKCKLALEAIRSSIMKFADWYAANLENRNASDLKSFRKVQQEFASASGLILADVLVPHWQNEGISLIQLHGGPDKSDEPQDTPPPAREHYIQNAEEFVCLNYLAFVQNILGNIRTVAITIIVLFLAVAVAISSYPFDPRQALSGVLVLLLAIIGFVIVSVYAGMYRDATLSHVTNTRPGELGSEFWFKLVGFGLAPVLGLLARIFPSITDFLFSWLQPSVSALK